MSDDNLDSFEVPTDPAGPTLVVSSSLEHICELAGKIPVILGSEKSVKKVMKDEIVAIANQIASIAVNLKSKFVPLAVSSDTTQFFGSLVQDVIRQEFANLQEATVNRQQHEQQVQPPPMLYSHAVTAQPQPSSERDPARDRVTRPALVIYSKEASDSREEIVKKWRKAVSFKNTSYAPAKIVPLSNNKIKVEFDTLEQRDETIRRVNSSEESGVVAECARKLKPMCILKGISKDIPKEEVVNIIVEQNETIKEVVAGDGDIGLRFTRRNRNANLYNAVLIMTPVVWRRVIELQKINLDHQRVHAEEYVAVMQCFNCMQYGHVAAKCTSQEAVCSHCAAQTHRYSECPHRRDQSKACCINCMSHNRKYDSSRNTLHSATSTFCPSYQIMKQRIIPKIDYGY